MKAKITKFFEKKENLYLSLALTFGFLMVFINPPFAGVPDEHAHYWKAWAVADGYWKCSGEDKIPQSAASLPDSIKPVPYEGLKYSKIVVAKIKQEFLAQRDDSPINIKAVNCPSTPFGYIPQALSLRFGQLLGISEMANVYLARFFTMIVSSLMIYWAIRIIPFGKMILLVVALLPLAVRQFASLSYDGVVVAFVMLFLAYILKLAFDEKTKIGKKEMIILLVVSLIGLNMKLGYFVLAPLLLLIPKEKYQSKKGYWKFIAVYFVLHLVLFFAIRSIFVDLAVPTWTNPPEQMKFVLANPFHFAYTMLDTIYGQKGFVPYFEALIFRLGTGNGLEWWTYLLIAFGFVSLIKNEEETVSLKKWHRWLLIGVFSVNVAIVYLALYLGWTAVGADFIKGVQGRYFLPLLPIIILAFYKSNFNLQFDWIKRYKAIFILILMLVTFGAVYFSLYSDFYNKSPKGESSYEKYLKDNAK